MSDTPRTDENEFHSLDGNGPAIMVVEADFARNLERENNDLRKLLDADVAYGRKIGMTLPPTSKDFATVEQLHEDKARLDWLEKSGARIERKAIVSNSPVLRIGWAIQGSRTAWDTYRQAIDAARKANQ